MTTVTPQPKMELVITPEAIAARVAELAAELSRAMSDTRPVLLGVLNGAFIFLSDLARSLDLPVEVDFVRVASYGASSMSSGEIRMTKDCEIDLSGRTVVVVEDIVDTGLTLRWLVDHLKQRGAQKVLTCALIDKAERRETAMDLDYVGFAVPKGFLVGYGLDYNEQHRCLPGIYEIKLDC